MDIAITKGICITSRAMLGNSITSLAKAKMPRTCGKKIVVDSLATVGDKMIVYVNGDSYSKWANGQSYCNFLAAHFKSPAINASTAGASNSRIFRTTLRDTIELKKTHDEIVAVISLAYLLRTEIWDTDLAESGNPFKNDGEFYTIQPATDKNWFYNKDVEVPEKYSKYATEWMKWYDPEAETANLLKEIIFLTSWFKQSKIKYVILTGALQEPVNFESRFIKPFYDEVLSDPNVIDIFTESFTQWCMNRGHTPIDDFTQEIHGKTYNIGHHGEEAHQDFATFLIENYIGNQ
jgi:hypothetical protein